MGLGRVKARSCDVAANDSFAIEAHEKPRIQSGNRWCKWLLVVVTVLRFCTASVINGGRMMCAAGLLMRNKRIFDRSGLQVSSMSRTEVRANIML
jgi:hypothetical protein